MKFWSHFLLIVSANTLLVLGYRFDSQHCAQKDLCKCEYEDGSGFDLSELAKPSYLATPFAENLTARQYLFHPCQDATITPNYPDVTSPHCNEYSVCLYDNHTLETIGQNKDATFNITADNQVSLVYKHDKITTTIVLACTTYEKDHLFIVQPNSDVNNHNLILYSKHACLKQLDIISHLSTGAVLVITFLIFLFAYLTIGTSVGYFMLGARGLEVIPNLSFWKDFPSLVLDGAIFLQNGCKARPSDLSQNQDIYTSI